MELKDKLFDWKGEVFTYINGELVDSGVNDITTLGRNWLADIFKGRTNVLGLTTTEGFGAVGYSGGTTLAAMSGLVYEAPAGSIGRTLIGSLFREVTGSTLYVSVNFYDSGAIGPIQEYGLFATGYDTDETTLKTASTTKDTGVLVARKSKGVITHVAGDSLNFVWRITL